MAAGERSMRERTVLAVLGVLALYAMLVLYWMMSQQEAWEAGRNAYEKAQQKYEREKNLIERRDYWEEQLDKESAKMPLFPEGKDVDTWWWQRVDQLASENHVTTPNHEKGAEEKKGDVFELALEARGWESSLKSLVKFMCALETASGAMFDVRDITINPVVKTGYLKTSFRLGCAYMRGDAEDDEEEEYDDEDLEDDDEDAEDSGDDEDADDSDEDDDDE
ncbi:MAG: hypothetical protein IJ802_00805 [Kiritimatiellae bacterium]|nr:hypothetical protein [Kiritimatiellia bacterium]